MADGKPLHLRSNLLPGQLIRDVFIVNGRITFTAPDDATTVLDGGYLTPGLVDAHAHLSLHSPLGDAAVPDDRVRASARAQLDAGVLAIREPGSPDYASQRVGPDDGLPRTITAGHLLARSGRYFAGLGREIEPDELPDAAEQEARASGAWAKVIADFFDPSGDITAAFPDESLAVRADAWCWPATKGSSGESSNSSTPVRPSLDTDEDPGTRTPTLAWRPTGGVPHTQRVT